MVKAKERNKRDSHLRAGVTIKVFSEVREASLRRDSWSKVSKRQGRESRI